MKKITTIILVCITSLGPLFNRSGQCIAQYTKLYDFQTQPDGWGPNGSLISDGTFLYGTTANGGANLGTIFRIKPDGTGYSKLMDFTGAADGSQPIGSLISDGTFLYGMVQQGGTNNLGTIFKIKPDGTGYSKLLDFAGAANGSTPEGSLMSDGTFLYGTTFFGGTNNLGTIFKIKPDGTGYAKLLDFSGAANGNYPSKGSLIFDGTFLYGTTVVGGTGGVNGLGTIFKIKPDGTGYFKLLDFAGNPNGALPYNSLLSDGTFLYGNTQDGGLNEKGTIFKIKPDGTGYSKLLDFSGAANGSYPHGFLISDGTFLYGMTTQGGSNNMGVLFKVKPDGTGYSKLLDFTGAANGTYPIDGLISDGTFLYGMTFQGGANNMGVIFRYCLPSTPGPINGNAIVCSGSSITYSISPLSGALSYTWTLPDGWSGTSTTTSITTTAGTTGGNISVTANHNCGSSAAQTLSVTIPSLKPTITVDATSNPEAPVLTSSSADSYQWFKDGTLVGSSQTLVVTGPGVYTVMVTINGCTSELSNPQPIIITGDLDNTGTSLMNIYPNPGSDRVILSLGGFEKDKPVSIFIIDLQGRVMERTTGLGQHEVSLDVRNYALGKYIARALQNKTRVSRSFIKTDR